MFSIVEKFKILVDSPISNICEEPVSQRDSAYFLIASNRWVVEWGVFVLFFSPMGYSPLPEESELDLFLGIKGKPCIPVKYYSCLPYKIFI